MQYALKLKQYCIGDFSHLDERREMSESLSRHVLAYYDVMESEC